MVFLNEEKNSSGFESLIFLEQLNEEKWHPAEFQV